ncbi:MAG: hypothetical protein AAB534_00050 [Patescibacteria group bacterium]
MERTSAGGAFFVVLVLAAAFILLFCVEGGHSKTNVSLPARGVLETLGWRKVTSKPVRVHPDLDSAEFQPQLDGLMQLEFGETVATPDTLVAFVSFLGWNATSSPINSQWQIGDEVLVARTPPKGTSTGLGISYFVLGYRKKQE